MFWATVSSWSCFCWLYRAFPSLAAKNIINLILVLTIWWCPCVEPSLHCWKRVFAMTCEKEMTTHSSVLAWRIPGMGEPGELPSMGSHRVRHDWSDLAAAAAVCSFDETLLWFALLHFALQGQICLLLQVSLDFLLLHSSPLWWKGHLWQVLVLEGLIGLHRTVQLQLLGH